MATGDQSDFYSRLAALMPRGWFSDSNPVLDAVLNGFAWALTWCYSLYVYSALQTRIKSATDGFLDLIALDFFGNNITRHANQSDGSFRNTIIINLFRERTTRSAIDKILYDLTGRHPLIFEPMRPADTGAYSTGGAGYSTAGGYGSLLMPFQAIVVAYRPMGQGWVNTDGYSKPAGGYNNASGIAYSSLFQNTGVTDADIIAALEAVRPAGSTIWYQIQS